MKRTRVGEKRQMNNGKYATILEYKDSRHCLVVFDGGYTTWCKYGNFVDGNVKYHENFIGKKFYDRFGDLCVVNDQKGGKLYVRNNTTKMTFIISEKQFPVLSKKSKILGRKYSNIDGHVYWIKKVYRSKQNPDRFCCDVRFETGERQSVDLSNAISTILSHRPRLENLKRTEYFSV